jgi:hypothetical protein
LEPLWIVLVEEPNVKTGPTADLGAVGGTIVFDVIYHKEGFVIFTAATTDLAVRF